jgi:hypothetical protein
MVSSEASTSCTSLSAGDDSGPYLEDLIDFLVTENLVHKHPQSDKKIAARRKAFHEK